MGETDGPAPDQPCDADIRALYSSLTSQWIHAEQIRWTILHNFLVGNTILLLAWATLYTALASSDQVRTVRCVLYGVSLVGLTWGTTWAFLAHRANRFAQKYFKAASKLEKRLAAPLRGGFTTAKRLRKRRAIVETHKVMVVVPVVFAIVYCALSFAVWRVLG